MRKSRNYRNGIVNGRENEYKTDEQMTIIEYKDKVDVRQRRVLEQRPNR